MQCAHRAAGASPVRRRAPRPCATWRVASPGSWGWESAWLCQPSLASARAGSSAASRRPKRNIHWRDAEAGGISTWTETRLGCRKFCPRTASPALPTHWSSARRRRLNGRFAPRLRRHRRLVRLRSAVLPLLRSSHRGSLEVC